MKVTQSEQTISGLNLLAYNLIIKGNQRVIKMKIDIEAIRTEMRKCAKNCSATLMIGRSNVSMIWRTGAHWSQAYIAKDACFVGSDEFSAALKEAKISLLY